jgi:glycosyltransferase involved in cell wall biosynthesis
VRTVVHFTDTTGFGGAERMMLSILQGTDRSLWRPVLMHYPNPGARSFAEEAARLGVETICVAGGTGARGARELGGFAEALRRVECEVFHAHLVGPLRATKGMLAARLAGVPVIVATQHLYEPLGSSIARARQRLVTLGYHRIIAVSEGTAKRLRADVADPHRVVVIHNAIDPAPFAPPASEPAAPVVLALARLHARKGIADLVAAAAEVPGATFRIAGDGPERPLLERRAREMGVSDRVAFLGTRTDAAELLRACTVFVLPSLNEGLPVSVIEAMAAGRPVVATRIEGTDEIVVDGVTGILVPPGDPGALASALRAVLIDPELRMRYGRAGRERVRREFSIETMMRRIEKVYDEVLRERGGER